MQNMLHAHLQYETLYIPMIVSCNRHTKFQSNKKITRKNNSKIENRNDVKRKIYRFCLVGMD